MANVEKIKGRQGPRTLGTPPSADEASTNLQAPEVAPPAAPPSPSAPAPAPEGQGAAPRRADGRSARRTGRTLQFATRVSPEFDDLVREIAKDEKLLIVEVLERAVTAYDAARKHAKQLSSS